MRLVHYYPRALVGDGGPTRAMWQWATATHSAGCDVAVLYDAALEDESALRDPAIRLVPVDHVGVSRLRVPRHPSRMVNRDDVLVLHSAYVPSNVFVASAARRHGVSYIVMPHGGYNRRARDRRHRRKRLWMPVERSYLEGALAVHLFFETEAGDAEEMAPNGRWIVAPTGYELEAGEWDGGSGGYLAWLGRYDIETKGLDLLIEAMTRIADRPRLRLHGKSSEDNLARVQQLAIAAGVADVVTVGGPLTGPDKAAFLQSAAAYVHPSRWESHSQALVEALSYGIPSVISAACSVAPKLRAADAAVIIDPTPDGIAEGIAAVLRNRRHYSERARDFVRANLAWPTIIDDYVRQIEHLRRGK